MGEWGIITTRQFYRAVLTEISYMLTRGRMFYMRVSFRCAFIILLRNKNREIKCWWPLELSVLTPMIHQKPEILISFNLRWFPPCFFIQICLRQVCACKSWNLVLDLVQRRTDGRFQTTNWYFVFLNVDYKFLSLILACYTTKSGLSGKDIFIYFI